MSHAKSDVRLKVRLHSLGPGRMEEQFFTVLCRPNSLLAEVLSKITTDYEIQEPAYRCPLSFMSVFVDGRDGKETVEEIVEELGHNSLEMWRCRRNACHDLYPDPTFSASPIKLRRGFDALAFAAVYLESDHFVELLPQFDARADYAESGIFCFSNLTDILVMVSGGKSPSGIGNSPKCLEMVKGLVVKPHMDLGAFPKVGCATAAGEAAQQGEAAILRVLLQAGAPTTGLFEQLKSIKNEGVYVEMLEVVTEHVSQGYQQPCPTMMRATDGLRIKVEPGESQGADQTLKENTDQSRRNVFDVREEPGSDSAKKSDGAENSKKKMRKS